MIPFFVFLPNLSFSHSTDIELIRHRLIEDAIKDQGYQNRTSQYTTTEIGNAEAYQESLGEDGRWMDIDYLDQDNEWDPLRALDRILVLTLAYQTTSHRLYQEQNTFNAINRALHYWYQENPKCKNWYKNDIAKQFYLAVTGILLRDLLNEELLKKIETDLTAAPSMTGSNRTLLSISVFYRGVIEGNPERLRAGIDGVLTQIEITDKEGIQPDHSFHQHGPFLYNGSYGHNFLRESLWLATMVRGTAFAYAPHHLSVLRDYFLEGSRWMTRGGVFDYNASGRQVGRSTGFGLRAGIQIPLCKYLALVDPDHSDTYQQIKRRIEDQRPQDLSGNRHFWRSDYTVHHKNKFFTSLKMCSNRTVGMEMGVNSENMRGFYLPFGLTYIYRTGAEYRDVFPTWDWSRLPGVTSPHRDTVMKGKSTQERAFVGGVSDSTYGVSTMDLLVKQTSAKKAWFWFDNEWVALGAGIESSYDAPIVTGINQVNRSGPLFTSSKTDSPGTTNITNPCWIWHDSISYVFPNGQDLMIKSDTQAANLQRIFGLGQDTIYTKDVFSLWINHGIRPSGASYQYIVSPGSSIEDAVKYLGTDSPIRILSNSRSIQAVQQKDLNLIGIVFHAPGTFQLPTGYTISSSSPCVLLLNLNKKQMSICDPTQSLGEIAIKVTGPSVSREAILVSLPTGWRAGQSTKVSF